MKKNYRVYKRVVRIFPVRGKDYDAAWQASDREPLLSEASAGTLHWLFGSWRRARRMLRQEGRALAGGRRHQGLRGRA